MSDSCAIVLTPNSFDSRGKSFTLGERLWKKAVLLADKTGLRINLVGGIARRDVTLFAQHVRLGLQRDIRVSAEDRAVLERLIDFLTTDGAKVGGLTLAQTFNKWYQV